MLGHFVEYDFSINHVTSHDNPSLSLIRNSSMHELIRGLRFADADGKPQRAFLVNDLADDESHPDAAYLTDGTTCDVFYSAAPKIEQLSESQYELSVVVPVRQAEGTWIYGKVTDPTAGRQKIVSVVRQSDGQQIDPYNFWLTDRTLYDYRKPVYENLLHFADFTAATGTEKYMIEFAPRQTIPLDVAHISASVSDFSFTTSPVDEIVVNFNSDIKPSSIRLNDNVVLTLDGNPLTLTAEMVMIAADCLTIKPATITDAPGFYQLTIDCGRIQDSEGYAGNAKRFFSWTNDKSTTNPSLTSDPDSGDAYDLLGRPVDPESHRGIIIRKGATIHQH